MVGMPSRRTGSGWEALMKGWEALLEGWEWSGVLPRGAGVVWRPFQRAGNGGRPSQRVGRLFRKSGSGL